MGRTVQALRYAGETENGAKVAAAIVPPSRGVREDRPTPIVEEEVPYIEVGWPGKAFEASSAVLATPLTVVASPPTPKPTNLKVVTAEAHVSIPSAPPQCAPAPLTVVFRPLAENVLAVGSPPERFVPELIAFHQPNHPVSEQYRSLLASLTSQLTVGGSQILLFAAASSEAGATTMILNLAITRARQSRKRVAVVDGNLRQPAVAGRLGLAKKPGLHEVLTGKVPLERAFQETGQPNFMILPAGELSAGGTWPKAEVMRSLLRQTRKHFDLVLVDGPSWDGGPEMATLIAACDAVYLVVKPREMDTPSVTELVRLIPHLGGYLGGYILLQR